MRQKKGKKQKGKKQPLANIVNHSGNGLSLRVSDDGNMAIEDTDLTGRQPKEFYATQAVVENSNTLLQRGSSRFRLEARGHRITILTGWWGTKNLLRVVPRFDNGSPNKAPQNCNAIAARVLGMNPDDLGYEGNKEGTLAAARIAGMSEQRWKTLFRNTKISGKKLMDDLAKGYVRGRNRSVARSIGANQYARPEVGDAFGIITIGHGETVDYTRGTVQVWDIQSENYRTLDWSYHFAGVVARSGKDRITLENYARGDDRKDSPDPRWYFQMFGEKVGQSFHEFYSAKPDYANPVTISHRNPNRVDPSWWQPVWDLVEELDTG